MTTHGRACGQRVATIPLPVKYSNQRAILNGPMEEIMAATRRSYNATWILSLLLGHLGVDRFYLGYVGLGILKLLTGGGFGIWYLIDLVLILTGQLKDKEGQALDGYEANKKLSWIVAIAVLAAGIIFGFFAFVISLVAGLMSGGMLGSSWT